MKKLCSWLLSLAMVASLVPTPALAEVLEEVEGTPPVTAEQSQDEGTGYPDEGLQGEAEAAEPTEPAAPAELAGADTPSESAELEPSAVPEESQASKAPNAPKELDADSPAEVPADEKELSPNEDQTATRASDAEGEPAFWFRDSVGAEHNSLLNPLERYTICSSIEGWANQSPTITFLPYDYGDVPLESHAGHTSFEIVVDEDDPNVLDGLFYEENGLLWPLPVGYYRASFEVGGETYTTETYSMFYNVHAVQGYFGVDAQGDLQRTALSIQASDAPGIELGTIDSTKDVDLRMTFDTVAPLEEDWDLKTKVQYGELTLLKATDNNGDALTIDELAAQCQASNLDDWPNRFTWPDFLQLDATGSYELASETLVWFNTSEEEGVFNSTWSIERTSDRTASFAINGVNFEAAAAAQDTVLESGVYFPILKVCVAGWTYAFAYNPIEVDRHASGQGLAPTISTRSLPAATVGEPYAATLVGHSGLATPGTLSWSFTRGTLPEGMTFDPATGTISGTPVQDEPYASYGFTVTLTETAADGTAQIARSAYLLDVREPVTLGGISYPTGAVWAQTAESVKIPLTVPLSADLGDEGLNLTKSKVRYYIVQTDSDGNQHNWGETVPIADVIARDTDGHPILQLEGSLQQSTVSIDSVNVEVTLYDNAGNVVLAPVEGNPTYEGDPVRISTHAESPDITFGRVVELAAGDYTTRVRLWPYDGTMTPTTQQVEELSSAGTTLKLLPTTYAMVVEAEVPVYDENGVDTGETVWVDVMGKIAGGRAVDGTSPKQYLVDLGKLSAGSLANPNELPITYRYNLVEDTEAHEAKVLFEMEDGSWSAYNTASNRSISYQTAWYRRVGGQDILVATGDYVSFGPSDHPLYVQVTPLDRDTSFWRQTDKIKVSDKNKTKTIKVARKQLFSGTFTLSCASGIEPEEGEAWGILEVQTPLAAGGTVSSNVWAYDSPATVTDVTSGSIITFSPAWGLGAESVSYTVPDDATSDFSADLTAPLVKGIIDFEGLHFVDARGQTSSIDLNDGHTQAKVERISFYSDGTEAMAQAAPFYVVDGDTIVLDAEDYSNEPYFLWYDADTTYRVTVSHGDETDARRLGVEADDYAARCSFDVTLSQTKTAATVPDATLVSRGYATVRLTAPEESDPSRCILLLYRQNGELIDKGPIGEDSELRTTFLDAGRYALWAVDSELLRDASKYETESKLLVLLTTGGNKLDHANHVAFEVADGDVTAVEDELALPVWASSGLIDRANSSVSAVTNYTDKVTIQMHAELAGGVTLSKNAYLEVVTNQASGVWYEGYMNPKALSINGKPITLNRWDNLFNQTQRMEGGELTILLAEAKKTNELCAAFPMDMTLVIPRIDMSCTEVSIWLVSDGKRSLVGSCRQEVHEASLHVPPVSAWKTFSVYGETGPGAMVTVLINGMRTATTKADQYGYYTAEVTLPDDVEEFEEYALSIAARWWRGGSLYTATSTTETVMYSTLFPAIERITMCWQSYPGSSYESIVTYYRGKQPDRYKTVYRGENEKGSSSGANHAKDFWMIEFANGELVTDVKVKIPRSGGSLICETTDKLATAEGWIPDVKEAGDAYFWSGLTGRTVRGALSGDEPHAFVTKPVYLSYGADEIDISFDLLEGEDEVEPMGTASDLGSYVGFRREGLTKADLAGLLDAMADTGYMRVCSAADADKLTVGGSVDLSTFGSSDDMAQSLMDASAGSVDEWLLLGCGYLADDEDDENGVLKLHHQASTSTVTAAQIETEIQGLLDDALPIAHAFESWSEAGGSSAMPDKRYRGDEVLLAGSSEYLLDESSLYVMVTQDADGNVQNELLEKYHIDGSDAYLYQLTYMDKYRMVSTSYDELHGQRTTVTLTLADDAVNGAAGVGFEEVFNQWEAVNYVMNAGLITGSYLQSLQDEDDSGDEDPAEAPSPAAPAPAGSGDSQSGDEVAEPQDEEGAPKRVAGSAGAEAKGIGATWLAGRLINEYFGYDQQRSVDNAKRVGSQLQKHDGSATGKDLFWAAADCVRGPVQSWGLTLGWMGTFGGPATLASYPATLASPGASGVADNIVDGTPLHSDFLDYLMGRKKAAEKEAEDRKKCHKDYYDYRWAVEFCGTGTKEQNDYWEKEATRLKKKLNRYRIDWLKQEQREYDARQARIKAATKRQNRQGRDPSGIVYEAVLSNPVEGATVRLYTFNPAATSAGLDPAQFVDSTQFGIEENPQVTGKDGRYQWFVPEGYWQVHVFKKGYESFSTGDWGRQEERAVYDEEYNLVLDANGDPVMEAVDVGVYGIDATKALKIGEEVVHADSYWMPVLPVQLDVNIPLVSTEAPKVASVEAGEEGVTVTFSKYVQVDSVSTSLFAIDDVEPSSLEALDGELAGDGSGVLLARTFLLGYPADSEPVVGDYHFVVSFDDAEGAVTSYAGVVVAEGDRVATFACDLHIDSIDLRDVTVTDIAAQTYTGKALTPTPTVTYDGTTLREGRDYTVAYANNTNAGTASVTITGVGRCVGQVSTSFKINKAPQTITAANKSVAMGKTVSLGVKSTGEGKLTYKSSSTAVAKVSATGVVTPVMVGTAKITITKAGTDNYNGVTKVVTVTVTQGTQTISVSKASLALTMGKTFDLKAKTSGDGKLTYKSSGATAVAVSSAGVLTPKNVTAKKVTITITAAATKNYKKATKTVTVTKVAQGAQAITVANTECVTGKAAKLGAKTTGNGKLTYKSANPKVAKVSATGVLTGVKAGTAKVTIVAAATKNFKKATKVVTVKVGKANTLAAKAKKSTVAAKLATLKTKAVVLASNITVAKPVGKVTYANASTNAVAQTFKVAAGTGAVTVPKGTKKGKYQVVITVKAAGNTSTISGTKTVKFYVQVA